MRLLLQPAARDSLRQVLRLHHVLRAAIRVSGTGQVSITAATKWIPSPPSPPSLPSLPFSTLSPSNFSVNQACGTGPPAQLHTQCLYA
jgi:hypothetical protein